MGCRGSATEAGIARRVKWGTRRRGFLLVHQLTKPPSCRIVSWTCGPKGSGEQSRLLLTDRGVTMYAMTETLTLDDSGRLVLSQEALRLMGLRTGESRRANVSAWGIEIL